MPMFTGGGTVTAGAMFECAVVGALTGGPLAAPMWLTAIEEDEQLAADVTPPELL